MSFLYMFIFMMIGHFLADYPLQGEFLSLQKNPWLDLSKRIAPWYQAMCAHCVIQAGFVLFLTGSLWIASLEFFFHSLIDITKCAGKISYDVDQALHLLCKILWIVILTHIVFL